MYRDQLADVAAPTGTPAWKTRSQYKSAEKLEHGIGLEKKLHDDESPERVEEVGAEKQDV